MKRFVYSFLLIGFLHLAYGLFVSFWRPQVMSEPLAPVSDRAFYDYAGAINIRTISSSGSGTYEDVIAAARAAQLNFIIITDFNNFHPQHEHEGYANDVLVMVGGEYSYLNSRILNFDMSTHEHLQGPGRSQMAFADILGEHSTQREEGVFVLAHPYKPGYQMKEPYPEGLNGIELMNLRDVWQNTWLNSKASFIWNIFIYPFNSRLAFLRLITEAGEREFALWDKLNQKNPTQGYFGSAAEAKFKLAGDVSVPFPSYETLFSIVKNHVLVRSELTGQSQPDRKKISDALRGGQFYMSLDMLQDPKGFETYLSDGGSLLPLGAKTKFNGRQEILVSLPSKPLLPFEIVIYKNGEKVLTSNSQQTRYTVHGPGVYRSVVRLKVSLPIPDGRKWINWIVTNPFYLR